MTMNFTLKLICELQGGSNKILSHAFCRRDVHCSMYRFNFENCYLKYNINYIIFIHIFNLLIRIEFYFKFLLIFFILLIHFK